MAESQGSLPLHGIQICTTGLSSDEDYWAQKQVKSLGGEHKTTLKEGVSCLIVKKSGSVKYRAAFKLNIPCVTMQWLIECKRTRSRVSFNEFLAKPFQGFIIACTQLDLEERIALEKLVLENGGTFVTELAQESPPSHLVAMRAHGRKYAGAKMWGVHVVSLDWIHECIVNSHPVPEQGFMITEAPKPVKQIMPSTKDVTTANPSTSSSALNSARSAASTIARPMEPPPSFLWDQMPAATTVSRGKSRLLENDTFYISGFKPEQRDYIVGLIVAGGGRRHHVLTMGVTKLLVGKDVDKKLLQEVKRHPCGPPCVKVEWLVDLLVPGYLEERRRERIAAAEAQRLEKARLEEAAREAERQREHEEEKENNDNVTMNVDPGNMHESSSRVHPAANADSQSFEHNFLMQHNLTRRAMAIEERKGYDASNSDNSQEDAAQRPPLIQRRGQSRGMDGKVSATRSSGATGERGRVPVLPQAIAAMSGLKRPSRHVELDLRNVSATDEADESCSLNEADYGSKGKRGRKDPRQRGRGLFPVAANEESQMVTWQETGQLF